MARSFRVALAVGLVLLTSLGVTLSRTSAQQQQQPATSVIRQTVTFIDVKFTKADKVWDSKGTGFFVFYPDKRLGENRGFVYLVTNRHVVQPQIDEGHIYPIISTDIRLNLRKKQNGKLSEDSALPPSARWHFPADEAVDLAAMAYLPNEETYELVYFPISSFVTEDIVKSRGIGEGDSVLFAGYFSQFPGTERIEPIIRQGILAMMPREEMQTTLNKAGWLYLADLHVFNGNSGSPLFVNMGGARNGILSLGGFPYMLIGVVSGYYYENSDLTLTVTTSTITGKLGANSGIALVVPADQVKALLDSSEFQSERDSVVAATQHN
jgi:Trypsin-like peptidase domain